VLTWAAVDDDMVRGRARAVSAVKCSREQDVVMSTTLLLHSRRRRRSSSVMFQNVEQKRFQKKKKKEMEIVKLSRINILR
jgi:hypothetical protein